MKARSIVIFGAVVAVVIACGPPTYKATLSGANEVPAVTSNGSGSVTVTLDGVDIDITGSYMGLSGAASGAHIHGPADAGEVVPAPACPLTFTEGTTAGSGTITGECHDFDVAGLNAGKYYVNVHTTA